jgi:BolA protein
MTVVDPGARVRLLRETLEAAFAPARLEIHDDGAHHIGHPGAREGGHFRVEIVAHAFAGRTSLECHRLVYAALSDVMRGNIHALSISARAPSD